MEKLKPLPGISRKRQAAALFFSDRDFIHRLHWTAKWYRTIRKVNCPTFGHPKELYLFLHREVLKQSAIDYLEFGVGSGTTMRVWSDMNRNPESRFFGFDSFFGLPEAWNPKAPKGTFGRNGTPPDLSDSRIAFCIGLFQDSLPNFIDSYQSANRIVIHNDGDLYSSTLYTLTMLNRLISPDTVVIFDEFYDVLHEYRALIDYSTAYRKSFEIIAATHRFLQVAVVFSNQVEVMNQELPDATGMG